MAHGFIPLLYCQRGQDPEREIQGRSPYCNSETISINKNAAFIYCLLKAIYTGLQRPVSFRRWPTIQRPLLYRRALRAARHLADGARRRIGEHVLALQKLLFCRDGMRCSRSPATRQLAQ